MKILIIGNGGREHAIGRKILQDNFNIYLYFYPGNGGTSIIGTNIKNICSISDLSCFAKKNCIDITIVGSEEFLMKEIVDIFNFNKLPIVGPPYKSARLEGDRIFAKYFMKKYNIPTPNYNSFSSYELAIKFLNSKKNIQSLVIKTNGIAYGKGSIITHNKKEAYNAITDIMVKKKFGKSGESIIIEEFIKGKEISVVSVINKQNIIPFISSKDYKKINENDTGLNTGGMGSVSPNPYMNNSLYAYFLKNILVPTLDGILSEKIDFIGFLYFGLIISNTNNKIYLLEYNTRMGDPETQSLLPIMKNNFLELLKSLFDNKINIIMHWKKLYSCCVIISSYGYPKTYESGKIINGLDNILDNVYISGAENKNGKWITNSGRVLSIVGLGTDIKQARIQAYKKVKQVKFDNIYFRRDIGLF